MVESGYIRRDDFTDEDGNTIPAVDFEGLIAKLAGAAEDDPTLSARLLRQTALSEFSEGGNPFLAARRVAMPGDLLRHGTLSHRATAAPLLAIAGSERFPEARH
jgi:hypothetical protein